MNWVEAESALRLHIETQWALGSYSSMPLVWENENEPVSESYLAVNIEGTYSDKGIYGSVGKRVSVEAGMVFFHCFVPVGGGKQLAISPVVAMMDILELQTVAQFIDIDGANPPTPVHHGIDELDREIPIQQPRGNYYRCSGSVGFIVRSVK